MTQLNTPYPSAPYLTGFLRSRGVDAVQEDLALALVDVRTLDHIIVAGGTTTSFAERGLI